jgi:hypothetical protein
MNDIAGSFGKVNYTVVGAYLAVLVAMGFYFARREKSIDDFFLADRLRKPRTDAVTCSGHLAGDYNDFFAAP